LSPRAVHVLSELRRTNIELADLEIPAFIVCFLVPMARQIIPELLIDAFVGQDPHERGRLVVRDENL